MTARSYLYVPGDQGDKVRKALGGTADAVILDLEDAVSPARKQDARSVVAEWIVRHEPVHGPAVWVRVNATTIEEDIAAVAAPGLDGVYVAKADPPGLETAAKALDRAERSLALPAGQFRLAGLVESADAVLDLRRVAKAARLSHLAFGEVDLAAELGMEPSAEGSELMPLRLALVLVSASAGLQSPVGPVWTALRDEQGLRATSRALRRLGYGGRAAIHPAQLAVIHEVFTPSAAEVERAREVLRRFEAADAARLGVVQADDGEMIDAAVVRNARRIIGLAEGERNR